MYSVFFGEKRKLLDYTEAVYLGEVLLFLLSLEMDFC